MGYCVNCGDDVRETGLGECVFCGADLRSSRAINKFSKSEDSEVNNDR